MENSGLAYHSSCKDSRLYFIPQHTLRCVGLMFSVLSIRQTSPVRPGHGSGSQEPFPLLLQSISAMSHLTVTVLVDACRTAPCVHRHSWISVVELGPPPSPVSVTQHWMLRELSNFSHQNLCFSINSYSTPLATRGRLLNPILA